MAEQYFRAKAYRRVSKTTPRPDAEAGPYTEPAAAADWAETWLEQHGTPDESFVDLYFNGEPHIHTSIYLTMHEGEKTMAILNSEHAKWPMTYLEGEGETFLPGEEPFGRDTNEWLPGDSDEDESGDGDEIDEAATKMDMSKDWDEKPDDKGGDDSEDDEDENGENDDEDSEDDDKGDSGEQDENGDDGDTDEEEVPRMTIFGKFKGPKGWRKRAETDAQRETNVFAVKFGVLDPDRHTTASQERNSRVEIRFIERDSRRDAGELRIRIPDGVTIRDDGKWLVAEIPYVDAKD